MQALSAGTSIGGIILCINITEYSMDLPRPIALPLATLYAELHDLASLDRPGGRREGSFSVKTIQGRRYWYTQRWQGRRRVQKSLGPESTALLRGIARSRSENAAWR